LECAESLSAAFVTIDSEHHSRTAMAGLSTVSPDGSGIVDGERPGWEIGGVGGDWEEARVEPDPLTSSPVGQGQARSRERRPGDSVVLNLEDEPDGVSRGGTDTAWGETEVSIGTANNDLNSVSSGGDRSGTRRVRVRRIGRRPHIGAEGDGIGDEGWRRGRGDGGGSIVGGPSGTGRILSVSLELGTNRQSGVLEVGEGVGRSVGTTIDGVYHASATVAVRSIAGLTTEYPNWVSIGYVDSEGGHIGRSDIGTHWLETRVKATIFLGARTSERRLGHSMVLGVKMVDNLVANICEDCLW